MTTTAAKALAAFLAGLGLTLALVVSGQATSPMRVGFNVGGGHQALSADLAAIGGSTFANFATPLDRSQDLAGVVTVRILRYRSSCPSMVLYGCTETITQLGQWVAATPGQTYELGNEPGNAGQDSRKGIVSWAKTVAQTIKANDPTATVLGPGWLNWSSGAATVYNALGPNVDAVAYHLYPSNLCLGAGWLAAVKATTDQATAYAAAHGKPVWMTEMSDDPSCSGSAANKTSNVAALRSYLAQKGVVGAIWFTEGDVGYGVGYLFNPDNALTAEGAGWKT